MPAMAASMLRPVDAGTAGGVLENHATAYGFELVQLRVKGLPGRANAGIRHWLYIKLW